MNKFLLISSGDIVAEANSLEDLQVDAEDLIRDGDKPHVYQHVGDFVHTSISFKGVNEL